MDPTSSIVSERTLPLHMLIAELRRCTSPRSTTLAGLPQWHRHNKKRMSWPSGHCWCPMCLQVFPISSCSHRTPCFDRPKESSFSLQRHYLSNTLLNSLEVASSPPLQPWDMPAMRGKQL